MEEDNPRAISSTYIPIRPSPLTPELIQKAEEELNETSESRTEGLRVLKNLIEQEEELVSRTDDAFLLRFLRARKFNCDRAFKLYQNYYSERAKNPVYINLFPSSVRKTLDENRHIFLPYRDKHGRPIFVVRSGIVEPSSDQFFQGFRTILLFLEKMIEDEATQINGIAGIMDFTGFRMGHFRHIYNTSNACSFGALQECFPARFKGAHMIFEPSFLDLGFAIIKPFISEKHRKRLFFHGHNLKSLYEYFPPSILPSEYGGELGPMDNSAWSRTLLSSEDSYVHSSKFGYAHQRQNNGLRRGFFGLF